MTDTAPSPVPTPDPGPRGRVALAVASAVDAVTGARRSRGSGVEVATQYRGGRAVGVRVDDGQIEVHIVALDPAVAAVAGRVHEAARRALEAMGDERPVAVFVDDLDVASLSPGIL